MEIIYAEKALRDVCLYVTFGGYILSLWGVTVNPWPAAGAAMLCMVLLIFSTRSDKPFVRYAPLPLLALCFIGVRGGLPGMIFPIPLMIYAGYLALTGRFAADYDDISRSFPLTSVFFAVICVAAFITKTMRHINAVSVPFFAMWLAATIVLLNTLRHRNAAALGVKFHLVNLAILAAVAALCLALSSHAFMAACGAVLLWLWQHVLSPLLMGFALLLVGIGYGAVKIFGFLFPDKADKEEPEFFEMAVSSAEQMYRQAEGGESPLFQAIMTALGIVIFIGLAVFVIMNIVKRRSAPRSDSFGTVTRESVTRRESRPAQTLLRGTPRYQVRHNFRRFMQLCASIGTVTPSDTSRQVCDLYRERVSGADPEDLRNIWLEARYSTHDVTAEDAKRSRDDLTALRAAQKAGTEKKK